MDNASIHRPAALRLLAASFGVNVRVVFLPAYSPELNPVRGALCRRPRGSSRASDRRSSFCSAG
jgi:transposase